MREGATVMAAGAGAAGSRGFAQVDTSLAGSVALGKSVGGARTDNDRRDTTDTVSWRPPEGKEVPSTRVVVGGGGGGSRGGVFPGDSLEGEAS